MLTPERLPRGEGAVAVRRLRVGKGLAQNSKMSY